MKERPILFSAPMVNAILGGRKTQTRRVVKPQPFEANGSAFILDSNISTYGEVGDRLWVRETWKLWEDPEDGHDWVLYRAGGKMSFPNAPNLDMPNDPFSDRWRPSIHMFRWMSRIALEITDIRVERVQDITEDDALAEGVNGDEGPYDQQTPSMCFETLWDSINGKKFPWESNPWVCIRSFRRIK